ncbi:uncharacterized protein PV09_05192 [Verruconis gallopava]|uniref:Exonuclease domain-containing protein n=1 Tax=Verruconis gallopava TaxID=253628 RepID=A0A0D1YS16_9PEZI|nr:uncharacterized protein PV09_05192 [Verruconis gallopava]KIW03417.1 hypothetical protein PV09_05192 [Verruconis gallopava]
MFSSTLFKSIPCPAGPDKCKLANCLFSHELGIVPSKVDDTARNAKSATVGQEHGDLKRRKLNNTTLERIKDGSQVDNSPAQAEIATPSSSKKPISAPVQATSTAKSLASVARPISPPASVVEKKASVQKPSPNVTDAAHKSSESRPEKVERLAPRMVAKISTPYSTRSALLNHIHNEVTRLNSEVAKSKDPSIAALKLTENQLIRLALDEEEEATKQPLVYVNKMKIKIGRYRKMPLNEWVETRRQATGLTRNEGEAKDAGVDSPVKIETGLSPSEELDMLQRFVLSPQQLSTAGFILTPPTDAQIADALKTIEISGGYETCDRCGTRFKWLDEPKEDGTMTTNGKCVYHWGKPIFPKREKTDHITGPKEALYSCCGQAKGSPGCTTTNSHVFKISASSPGRLASILQFQTTPLNTKAERMAVAFDCEMSYTTAGLEIVRLSACKWPSKEALIDVLVRPFGKILDLNTKFSGVTPEQFSNAIDFDPEIHTPLPEPGADGAEQQMKIVASPAAARTLLTSYISPTTVLIGHAIENDLNVLRLLHPTIVDTSLLFPHHGGLPYRFPLRKLAKDLLNLDIQTADAAGHDSMEDSRATGDLVRVKIGREWDKLVKQGWSVDRGKFYATIGGKKREASLPPYMDSQGYSRKRKDGEAVPPMGQVGESEGLKRLLQENSETKDAKL